MTPDLCRLGLPVLAHLLGDARYVSIYACFSGVFKSKYIEMVFMLVSSLLRLYSPAMLLLNAQDGDRAHLRGDRTAIAAPRSDALRRC
jgi:hypothetical protein